MNKKVIVSLVILIPLLIVIVGLGSYAGSLGAFQSVEVTEKEAGPFHLAYLDHLGPYQEVGPVFSKLIQITKPRVQSKGRLIGIYYDDPSSVPQDKLRSAAALEITPAEMAELKANPPEGLKFRTLPRRGYVRAQFPFKSSMSYMVGAMKVYPAIGEYIEEKEWAMPEYTYDAPDYQDRYALEIEQGDMQGKFIEYLIVKPASAN